MVGSEVRYWALFFWKFGLRISELEGLKLSVKFREMSQSFHMVVAIDDSKETFKLAVRIRDRIHVIVKKEDLKNWEVELKEGKTYYMYNFRVVPNDGQYKVCAHPFKLFFTGGTTLRQVDLAEIPLKSFEFKSFEDIDNGNYDPNMLIGINEALGLNLELGLGLNPALGLDLKMTD
ncbi:hypothetical protein HKD37_08G023183 [Glycine soja]